MGLVCPAFAQNPDAARSAARGMMERKLYKDAVRVLLAEVKSLPEDQASLFHLMLAESYYMQKEYATARPYYLKAQRFLSEDDLDNRVIVEYRLACVAYRMNDAAGAAKLTEAFLSKRPNDSRSGSLLLFKMQALAKRGAAAAAELEEVREHISRQADRFGPATDVAADNILTDFYLTQGGSDKAKDRYRHIVMNFQQVTRQFIDEHRPIPAALERGHDKAAIQLASIALAEKDYNDSVRWLNIVRYDEGMKRRARLLLAQVAYEQKDFRRAERYLIDDDFIQTVPSGPLRSDMYLLLGFCAKLASHPTLERVAGYFSKVEPGTKAYFQAQMGLGDTYVRWRRRDKAIAAYENAKASPKYESLSLASVAQLYIEEAEAATGAAQSAAYARAAERLQMLTEKYPNSREAKDSHDMIEQLIEKGYDIKLAETDADVARKWDATAAQKPGSAEAARALINLARLHNRTATDKRTRRVTKAPDYASCARAADQLLKPAVYKGTDLDPANWATMQSEARYYRGYAHMASVTRSAPTGKGDAVPKYVASPSMDRALKDLRAARATVDEKQVDLVKNIELGLLETMLKSGREDLEEEGRKRLEALTALYGSEDRFQKLAYDLAKWFQGRNQFADAAREYRGIADRAQSLSQEDRMQLMYLAGQLYSKAAYDAANRPGGKRFAVSITTRHVFRTAGLLDTHKPFAKQVKWPASGDEMTAEQALRLLSRASGIPFVWSAVGGAQSVATYLKSRKLTFDQSGGTVKSVLKKILDSDHHRLAFDIGLTDMTPTTKMAADVMEDPEMVDVARVIEIIDERHAATRYEPLTRAYGSWSASHKGNTMLFHVVERIGEISETPLLWGAGVNREDVLAAEFKGVPGVAVSANMTCAQVLQGLFDTLDLRFQVVRRDLSSDLYDRAKNSFNEVRRISPKSKYGEKALFTLALNFFHQQDYERMKVVLTEYLKIFDNPNVGHYHDASFWVGWVFEHDQRYREACRYYNRAAEEQLEIYRPAPGEKVVARDERRAQLSYDTAYALEETYSGRLTNASLTPRLVDFVRLHTGIAMSVDPGLLTSNIVFNSDHYEETYILDILNDVFDDLGLAFRAENVNRKISQKAYFRMARSYQKDGLPQQALATCRVLLDRYPATDRRQDVFKLQLEVYKALKDYRNVLATLELLKEELEKKGEGYKVDFEIAWVYFDLARYADSIEHFKRALAGAQTAREQRNIRDGYARALYMQGDLKTALKEYRTLLGEENVALRAFVDEMMIWYLERVTGATRSDDLTAGASKLMNGYEALSESQRQRASQAALAKVTWVYYVTGLIELKNGNVAEALQRLNAAGNSPDDWLAANAMYQVARIHMKAGKYRSAVETLEYLLFATTTAEGEIKAAFALGRCFRALKKHDQARHRFQQILDRFPDSPYADLAEKALKEADSENEASGAPSS
jgi:tetratricopeptide (TPR) repeat protein